MKLIAVTNDKMGPQQLTEKLLAIEPHVDAVILREKSKTDVLVIDILQAAFQRGFSRDKIIVHGRPDIATLLDVSKVQLPSHGLPVPLVKKHFPRLTCGRSVHSLEEAKIAADEGADWVLYGHLFPTASKEGLPPRSMDTLLQIVETLTIPVYGIGGIQAPHVPALHQAGIDGVAVMSTIFNSSTPQHVAKSYRTAINERSVCIHDENN